MKVQLKRIYGNWDMGFALDKRIISSVRDGSWDNGHPKFNTLRTEAGEASFQLKFRNDFTQVPVLAQALAEHIYPLLDRVGFIVPMPASTKRARQPVTEVSNALGEIVDRPVFDDMLLKEPTGKSLKDLSTKAEKLAEIGNSISLNDELDSKNAWNVLLVDDTIQSGATMEKACRVLRTSPHVKKIYVAAMSWSKE